MNYWQSVEESNLGNYPPQCEALAAELPLAHASLIDRHFENLNWFYINIVIFKYLLIFLINNRIKTSKQYSSFHCLSCTIIGEQTKGKLNSWLQNCSWPTSGLRSLSLKFVLSSVRLWTALPINRIPLYLKPKKLCTNRIFETVNYLSLNNIIVHFSL